MSIYCLTSFTVWVWLNLAVRREPSANLIWSDVVGWLGSRGTVGGGVVTLLALLLAPPPDEELPEDELITDGA